MYICGNCQAECGQATTLIEHYINIHNTRISKETAKELGQLRKNWYTTRTEPKIPRALLKCKCGKDFTGSSNLNKHIRNKHSSTDYAQWQVKSEKMSPNVESSELSMETDPVEAGIYKIST